MSVFSFKKLRRDTLEAVFLKVVGTGLLFVMFTSISRSVGIEQFGTFSFAYMLSSTLAFVTPLGWNNLLLRFVPKYLGAQSWSLLRGLLRRAHQVTLFASFAASILLLLVSLLLQRNALTNGFRYAALLVPLQALILLRRKAFQAFGGIRTSLLVQDVLPPMLVLIALLVFTPQDVWPVVLIYFSACVASIIISNLRLRRLRPNAEHYGPLSYETRKWMSVAWPMLLGGFGNIIMNRTDTIMLGILTDMETVGYYTAAYQLAILNVFVLNAVNAVTTPRLSSAYQRNDAVQFKKILRTSMLWSTLGAAPLFLVILSAPTALLSLFGASFADGRILLIVLAGGQFVNALTGSVGLALQMAEKEKQAALSLTVVACLNIVGNLVTIPLFGALGASIVTASSLAILNIWQFWLARQIFPEKANSL